VNHGGVRYIPFLTKKKKESVMVKKILAVLVGATGIFAGYAAMQPSEYTVSRSLAMDAPAAVVFDQVNDLSKWDAWSPWAKLDPNATHSLEGPQAGTGSIMRWAGNNQVGAGMMTIVDSRPNELVQFTLDFDKPLKSTATSSFSFEETGGQTNVTWSITGQHDFLGKVMGVIFNCEAMIGEKYDEGLKNLHEVSVASAAAGALKEQLAPVVTPDQAPSSPVEEPAPTE
jgi:hypothetical protein